MDSVNLKKSCAKRNHPKILRFACFKIDKAQRHQYSTFDVGRSMFDVQSVHCSGQADFNISGGAGLKGHFFQAQSRKKHSAFVAELSLEPLLFNDLHPFLGILNQIPQNLDCVAQPVGGGPIFGIPGSLAFCNQ